ncbi:hypothetical protein K488DRAFT_87755 [Vararia minispora EC-137]|uniref:Uncharacterized protein n=1 Tax=Vararia minispora EC-137 TaxID=1314806 RepID=A0ACB8QFM7_9AGAM|nr:hypothetical protein K488DRAFT_87755 [Vararia minispora EC-137]
MALNEQYWDDVDGYLYQVDTAGVHDTRATAMWAAALLARNGGNGTDVARAVRIIEQVAAQQYTDNVTAPWYGTYPHSPQDPFPGTSLLGSIPYTTYDPNWRDFVGTAWLLALEESGDLLPDTLVETMEQSLRLVGKGQLLRYQGRGEYANSVFANQSVDNLDQAYTNPWLMGTIVMSYIGHRLNDSELIEKADEDAQAVYDLFTFNNFNTFSEYNSGTYTGVDIWALSLWIRYGPEGTKLKEYGQYMLNTTMTDISDFYHADLRNLAGPWDRTYGFDMTRYHAILGQVISSLAPAEKHATPSPPIGGLHINDAVVFGPLIPLIADTVANNVSVDVLSKFSNFTGERDVQARRVRTNTEDPTAIRNVTVWLGKNLAIGGQSLDEPYPRNSAQVTGAIQWLLPSSLYSGSFTSTTLPKIGYIVVSPPMAGTLNATASANTLSVSLPQSTRWTNATLPPSLNFAVGGFDMRTANVDMTKGLLGVPGLNISVETVGLGEQSTTYDQNGENNFYFFNVSYPVTVQWPTVPSITITVFSAA